MKPSKGIAYWLLSGCVLTAMMVIIGGITRLTNSGLSMVEWGPIMGAIPPLTAEDWNSTFSAYQQSPEFRLLNYNFTLEDFKVIFWWEYLHRLLGRIIGLVFLIPFVYFLFKKKLTPQWIGKLIIVFLLGAFQGVLGWYMVKSGLVNNPHVSHYRLAAHLTTAMILFSYILWLSLDILSHKTEYGKKQKFLRRASPILLFLIFIQIVYGALVAGLNAGLVYNTYPKMGDKWIPESILFAYTKTGIISLFENMATVQFIHRYLAVVIFILTLAIWVYVRKISANYKLRKVANLLLIAVSFQFILGILTLLQRCEGD